MQVAHIKQEWGLYGLGWCEQTDLLTRVIRTSTLSNSNLVYRVTKSFLIVKQLETEKFTCQFVDKIFTNQITQPISKASIS